MYVMYVKHCGKCKKSKPLIEFSPKAKWCRPCVKEYRHQYYLANKGKENQRTMAYLATPKGKEKAKQYAKNYASTPEGRKKKNEYARKYRKTEKGKTTLKKGIDKYLRLHPHVKKAKEIVRYHIRTGRIKKEPCLICNTTDNLQAHHEDYSKPLEIIWLCRTHHKQYHLSCDTIFCKQ